MDRQNSAFGRPCALSISDALRDSALFGIQLLVSCRCTTADRRCPLRRLFCLCRRRNRRYPRSTSRLRGASGRGRNAHHMSFRWRVGENGNRETVDVITTEKLLHCLAPMFLGRDELVLTARIDHRVIELVHHAKRACVRLRPSFADEH